MRSSVYIALLLFFFTVQQVRAQTYTYETEPTVGWWSMEYTAVEGLVSSLVASLPSNEQAVAESVNVVWTDGSAAELPHAFVAEGGSREVRIPKAFVHYLFQYIQMVSISVFVDELDIPLNWNLPEAWLSGLTYRSSVDVDWANPAIFGPTNPYQFFQLDKNDTVLLADGAFEPMFLLFNMALFDVLMHEIGHHVTGRFYPSSSSADQILAAETAVDDWVYAAVQNPNFQYNDGSYVLIFGRAFALAASVEQLSAQSQLGVEGSHLHQIQQRAIDLRFDDFCISASHIEVLNDFCGRLRTFFVETVFVERNHAHYLQRANSGEAFASFVLGSLATRVGEDLSACEYFLRASNLRFADSMLAGFLANCHLNNTFNLAVEEANRLTAEHLCNALRHGWLSVSPKLKEYRGYLDDGINCESVAE